MDINGNIINSFIFYTDGYITDMPIFFAQDDYVFLSYNNGKNGTSGTYYGTCLLDIKNVKVVQLSKPNLSKQNRTNPIFNTLLLGAF